MAPAPAAKSSQLLVVEPLNGDRQRLVRCLSQVKHSFSRVIWARSLADARRRRAVEQVDCCILALAAWADDFIRKHQLEPELLERVLLYAQHRYLVARALEEQRRELEARASHLEELLVVNQRLQRFMPGPAPSRSCWPCSSQATAWSTR